MRRGVSVAVLTIAGAVIGACGPAIAGVGDSPIPVIETGESTLHIFTVPGVVKNNNLETEFVCTSLSSTWARVAVEVFPASAGATPIPPGNNVEVGFGDGAADVSPGGTVTIGTGNTAGIHEDEVITGLAAGSVKNGSARILSTTKLLTCTAFLADDVSDPPASMVSLPVIVKKQKGD